MSMAARPERPVEEPERPPAASVSPDDPLVERRQRDDRRQGDRRRQQGGPAGAERRSGQDRRAGQRRARGAGAYDLSAEEMEFLGAIDRFRVRTGRSFPTVREILQILHDLGYEKQP